MSRKDLYSDYFIDPKVRQEYEEYLAEEAIRMAKEEGKCNQEPKYTNN